MRILYANICTEMFEGHRLFDVEWVRGLSQIAQVDLIETKPGWYENVPDEVTVRYLDLEHEMHGYQWLDSKLFHKGILYRIGFYKHMKALKFIKLVDRMDLQNDYDLVLAAHLDLLAFLPVRRRVGFRKKLYLMEHMTGVYDNKIMRKIFDKVKNDMNHIVMEKNMLDYFISELGVEKGRMRYVPHPLNSIKLPCRGAGEMFDIVGISNSNEDSQIEMIVEYEKQFGYFKKNRIRVLLRSQKIKFDNGWLVVFSKHLGIPFEEFYGYILNCKIVLLPFDVNFGGRTSGTIIDALSNRKLALGTDFATMRQYQSDYPSVCKVYVTIDDLIAHIEDLFARSGSMAFTSDFDSFLADRSDENMKQYYIRAFKSYRGS